jgi:dTDP-4-dehydrorhamnose 3,5-epimerase
MSAMSARPKKDAPSVAPDGTPLVPLIHGVEIRYGVTQTDERGSICEILDPAWGFHPDPIVYLYELTIRPGKIKGWHVHHLHDDRIFISRGELKVVLYDDRADSQTFGMVNEVHRSERHRSIMVIPAHVFHAHQNIGDGDVALISMPTRPYNHADPDVYRLPLDTDQIPYRFENRPGW